MSTDYTAYHVPFFAATNSHEAPTYIRNLRYLGSPRTFGIYVYKTTKTTLSVTIQSAKRLRSRFRRFGASIDQMFRFLNMFGIPSPSRNCILGARKLSTTELMNFHDLGLHILRACWILFRDLDWPPGFNSEPPCFRFINRRCFEICLRFSWVG